MILKNKLFETKPGIIHNHSPSPKQEIWEGILQDFFTEPPKQLGPSTELTAISFSTPHNSDLLVTKCLEHLGIPGIIKPLTIQSQSIFTPLCEAIEEAPTPYVLFLHPHDSLLMGDPISLIRTFESHFSKTELLFSGDLVSWPPLPAFMRFEMGLPGSRESDFKHLNGGAWLGKKQFCLEFMREAESIKPIKGLPHSPQAILRQLFAAHHPKAQIDHECRIFQSLGYVNKPIFEFKKAEQSMAAV